MSALKDNTMPFKNKLRKTSKCRTEIKRIDLCKCTSSLSLSIDMIDFKCSFLALSINLNRCDVFNFIYYDRFPSI